MTRDRISSCARPCAAAGGKYRVVKNNLAEKASEGTPSADVLKGLRGMTSLAYTTADPVALAKALTTYAKTNPSFTFKAGMVEGRVIDIKAITDLATMPSKEEIFAKLLYLINAPAQRLVTAIERGGPESGGGRRPGRQRKQVSASSRAVLARSAQSAQESRIKKEFKTTWRTSTQLRIRFRA